MFRINNKNVELEDEMIPRKKKKISRFVRKVPIVKIVFGIILFIAVVSTLSYAYFTYYQEDSREANMVAGEAYVRVLENSVNITLDKLYPEENDSARERNDNYVDFTINGKNTSATKSLFYTININDGAEIANKTRISREYIKVDLQEKINGEYVYIQEAVNLNNFDFSDLVPKNTTNIVTREYRLRVWVSDSITISDTTNEATFTQSEFNNLYATFSIEVSSKDKDSAYSMLQKNADTETIINFSTISSNNNGKGLYLLSGTSNDEYPVYYYRGDVNNNNVIFGGFCWQIIRTTDTGGIKMIYNGSVTGNGETCENTTSAARSLANNSLFNANSQSMSDVGYMSNKIYPYVSGATVSGAYFGTEVAYDDFDDDGSYEYQLVSSSASTSKDATHHYSCNLTDVSGTCTVLRYYQYSNYYIELTNGEIIDDALYKMTGNGTEEVKNRLVNQNYNLNKNDSTIKTVIENWFKNNLTNEVNLNNTNYRDYIEDTVYCNDRSYKTSGNGTLSQSGWNYNGGSSQAIFFGANNRILNSWYSTTNVPNFACPNETDQFSISNPKAKLKYPVGLLTADEMVLAGAAGNSETQNNNYYLYSGAYYWGMSPYQYVNGDGRVIAVNSNGSAGDVSIGSNSLAVRPVISLKKGVEFQKTGNGTPTDPYVVKYN